MYLRAYHGTKAESLPYIIRFGLTERGRANDSLPLVCFTVDDRDVIPSRKLAHKDDISAFELAQNWGDGTVVEVHLVPDEWVELFEDEGDGGSSWEVRVRGPIPVERLIIHGKDSHVK